MTLRHFSLLAIPFLAGCAGEAEMRSVSGQTAEILTAYRSSLQQFAASQTRLNAVTEARLDRLKQMRETRQAEISARVDSWKLADDEEALLQLGVVSSTGASEVLANANPQLPSPGLPALKYEPAEVDALIKPLLELKKPVTPRQRVEQLIAYGSAVRDAYEKDLAAAAASAATTATATAQKADQEEKAQAELDKTPAP